MAVRKELDVSDFIPEDIEEPAEELDVDEIRVKCCICLAPFKLKVATPERKAFWQNTENARNFKCNPCTRDTERKSRFRMRRMVG